MPSTEAEAFLDRLEDGEEVQKRDSDGVLGEAWMLQPKAILRAVKFISPYIPHRVTHIDSRYPNAVELWRKWQAYLAGAEAKKQEILSRPKAPPAPAPAASSPAKPIPVPVPPAPPSKPMSVVEVQRMLRRKGG